MAITWYAFRSWIQLVCASGWSHKNLAAANSMIRENSPYRWMYCPCLFKKNKRATWGFFSLSPPLPPYCISHAILISPSIPPMTNELYKKFWLLLYHSIQGRNLQFTKEIIILGNMKCLPSIFEWLTICPGENSNTSGIAPCSTNENESISVQQSNYQTSMFFTWQPWPKVVYKKPQTNKAMHLSLLLTLHKMPTSAFCLFCIIQNPTT